MKIDKLVGGSNFKYLLAAIGLGGIGGYLLAKQGGFGGVFSSNYVVPANMHDFVGNNLTRSFPNMGAEQRWNTLPNPNLEINVPLDAFDRYSTIQGAYGQQYSYIGTPS